MVICFKCRKDNYFALSCLELKDIKNIKEIEEEEMSNKLKKKKKNFRERLPLKVSY
jgi:hypothetical protein